MYENNDKDYSERKNDHSFNDSVNDDSEVNYVSDNVDDKDYDISNHTDEDVAVFNNKKRSKVDFT